MYAVGKVVVAFWISCRTWLASLQPNMGSLYIAQYLQHAYCSMCSSTPHVCSAQMRPASSLLSNSECCNAASNTTGHLCKTASLVVTLSPPERPSAAAQMMQQDRTTEAVHISTQPLQVIARQPWGARPLVIDARVAAEDVRWINIPKTGRKPTNPIG